MNEDVLEFLNSIEPKQKQKESVYFEHKETIEFMLKQNASMKDIHKYLTLKYDLEEQYPSLTKWIKRNIKKSGVTSTNKKNIETATTSIKDLYNKG